MSANFIIEIRKIEFDIKSISMTKQLHCEPNAMQYNWRAIYFLASNRSMNCVINCGYDSDKRKHFSI